MTDKSRVPLTWRWTTLEDIGAIGSGGTPSTSDPENFDGGVPWITPADLTSYSAKTISRGRRNLSQKGLETSSARILPRHTVLFSSRAPIGYVAIAASELATNQGFKSVTTHADVDENFVYFYLKSAKALAEKSASGTTFKEISGSRFAQLAIPLAPVNEQRRIVEKVETLFAQLDKGEEAIRQVQNLLKTYRQSVLKAAVTGELTRDWREANKDKLEPASDLLARILKTRRENWQGRGKYKEPQAPDTTGLPDLPDEWTWANVDQIADVMGGLTKNGKRRELPFKKPMLRVANVYQNDLRLDDIHEIGVSEKELERVTLENLDLLIVEGNGSKDQIGRMAVWRNELPNVVHQNHIIKARFLEKLLVEFTLMWFQSAVGRQKIENEASSTSGLHTLSLSKIRRLVVPIPSLIEVEEVAFLVNEAFLKTQYLVAWCETELERSASLRQSILKQAFSGKLVPQDPDDEPASVLLERIKAEREANKPATKRSRKKTAKRKIKA